MKEKKRLGAYIENVLDIANSRFSVKSGNWVKGFVIMAVLGVLFLCLYNYFVDPFNYFDKEYTGVFSCSQYYKAKYILDNPDEYDCFIIGGSNSGVLNPELIDKYANYKTYSMTFEAGNWYNYYFYTRFLIENTDVKYIVLHLSSTEMYYTGDLTSSESRRTPALIKNSRIEEIKESIHFFSRGVKLGKAGDNTLIRLKRNGMFDWSIVLANYKENPEEFVQQYVLTDYEDRISKMDYSDIEEENIEEAIDYAKQIRKLCDDNDVELVVISGPVFISKRPEFECDAYYEYLQRLVGIMDVYDFSDVTKVNANPYNFYDYAHYNDVLGEKVINTVFGNASSDIGGEKLSSVNIGEYIQNRREKYRKLLKEYQSTGTVEYESYDSDSRIAE